MANRRQTSPRLPKARASNPIDAPAAPSYTEALKLYQQGVEAVQAHEYTRASTLLRSVLARYPDETELHERLRLYLNVCERHLAPGAAVPSTPEERVFAATLAINTGDYGEALEHLRIASRESPDHDHALYMLATVLTLRNQFDEAAPFLIRAIALNPDNRWIARHDPDLGPLRSYDSVRAVLDPSSAPGADRRRPARRR